MKKYLLVLICFLAAFGVKAQTYSHGHLTVTVSDSMVHDSVLCRIYRNETLRIIVDSSWRMDTLYIVDSAAGYLLSYFVNYSGTSPWLCTYNYNCLGFDNIYTVGSICRWTFPVIKVASSTDTIYKPSTIDSITITDPCSWGYVGGRIYVDYDSNCVFSSGDVGLSGIVYNCRENLSSIVDSIYDDGLVTSGGGWFRWLVQESWMINYTVSIPPYFAFIFPASACFSGTSRTFTVVPVDTADFPLKCTSMIDVECGIMPPGRIRLHRDFYLDPYVNNTGCDTASGTMTLVLDSRVNYDSALSVHPADTVRGDTLIWNYSGLTNLSSGSYWNSFISNVYLSLDSTVVVGDTLCFRVYTNVPSADINASNNDYFICVPVVYSYDPNSKEVSPAGNISSHGDTLTYTIHFQNTGSDIAENIRVVDTLDSRFNMSSLKILSASHAMTPKWLASNVVEFDFDNINLPDSTSNEPGSHGVVQFSIALNPGTAIGTQIKNKGYIYFDLNPPVLTNTTVNTVTMLTLATKPPVIIPVKIYPNPATDKITVENLNGGQISILNMNGSIVYSQEVSNQKTEINVSNLPDGIYIIKTVSKDATSTIKFTKQ